MVPFDAIHGARHYFGLVCLAHLWLGTESMFGELSCNLIQINPEIIFTSGGIRARRFTYMYRGKCGEMSVNSPDTTSRQIRRELSTKPDINNWYMLLQSMD